MVSRQRFVSLTFCKEWFKQLQLGKKRFFELGFKKEFFWVIAWTASFKKIKALVLKIQQFLKIFLNSI